MRKWLLFHPLWIYDNFGDRSVQTSPVAGRNEPAG